MYWRIACSSDTPENVAAKYKALLESQKKTDAMDYHMHRIAEMRDGSTG